MIPSYWAEQTKEIGLDANSIEVMRTHQAIRPAMPTHVELFNTLTSQASTFRLEDIYRQAAVAAQGILNSQELKSYVAALLKDDQLVSLGKDKQGIPRHTTLEMLEIERGIARHAESRLGEIRHRLSQSSIGQVIRSRPTISDEQKSALHYITRDSGGIACVQGIAGSGKSYLMDACREAFEKSGFTLRGCALSGKAAQGLQEGSHIPSQTLHSLLNELEKGRFSLTEKHVIVLDEAGMVGSRQFSSLLKHLGQSGAKLVAIGDTRQLQPIDAGGAFRILMQTITYAELNEIRRQQSETDRQVVRDLATGNAAAAMASLEARDLVKDAPDQRLVMEMLVADWQRDATPARQKLVLAGTRSEARELNRLVREALKSEGKLGAVSAEIEVTGGHRQFAEGDRLLFTRNNLKLGVKNGTLGTIARIGLDRNGECELTVKTDEGLLVKFSPTAADGYNHLDHGYAMSVHKAQGVTVSRAYLLASETMGDREWAYVAASRAREATRLYCTTDMKQNLDSIFIRSRQKTSSLDYLETEQESRKPGNTIDKDMGRELSL